MPDYYVNLLSPPGITQHSSTRHERGLTLVEMMFAIAILAILIAIGVPAMGVYIEKNRLKGAAEALFSDLTYARSEAIKRNQKVMVRLSVTSPSEWCYGIDADSHCDCRITDVDPEACTIDDVLKTTQSNTFPSISLESPISATTFTPQRGTANGGTFTFRSKSNDEIRVIVNALGMVRRCSPDGDQNVNGYPICIP